MAMISAMLMDDEAVNDVVAYINTLPIPQAAQQISQNNRGSEL